MGAHADILRSLLQQLDRFDFRIRGLTARNDERTALTQKHIGASAAQMTNQRADSPDVPALGKNRAFSRS